MSYIPFWVGRIPNKDDPNYYSYLINQAKNDGVPEHVRKTLIAQYMLKSNGDNNE